jgi:hypothetical protein
LLQLCHPLHSRHCAGELGENTISHGFENAAAVAANGGPNAVRENMMNCRKCCGFIKLGQP